MTIKASDLTWAKVNFSDTEEAKVALTHIEGEVKALKKTLAEGWFDDAFTEREMRKELARLEALEEELCDALFQDLFDLL
jgi:hypothetical protein